jgi:hypothetical protein
LGTQNCNLVILLYIFSYCVVLIIEDKLKCYTKFVALGVGVGVGVSVGVGVGVSVGVGVGDISF